MPYVELSCVALLLLAVVLRARAPGFRRWLSDAPWVFLAAWLGETSAIRLYGFYRYSEGWHGFLDVTPALIPAIWVFVVLSARDLAAALAPDRVVPLGALLILFDASFIEPCSTFAGLWRWMEPGPFGVPYIGTLGWSLFGLALLFCLERLEGRWRWASVLLAPLLMHALLLLSWWGALRWVGRDAPEPRVYGAVFAALCVALCGVLWRTGRVGAVPLPLILPRLGPALFFFALLWSRAAPPLLWGFAAAFALPWVVVTGWRAAASDVDGPRAVRLRPHPPWNSRSPPTS